MLQEKFMVATLFMLVVPSYSMRMPTVWTALFPTSCYSRALEVCMRILEDEWKAYDTVTAEDLCVGRFMRLFKEVSSLEYIHAHCQPYLTEDLEYMVRLIDRVVEGKKNYMSSSGTLMLLIRSIRNKLERMLL